ncbi:olfactory receptor 1F1-like [Rhinoderma darwinii]|uniref:olfactory receptor 1F1-like n=1 Tax=Rhinoderma darwinii TaxID=43563 RepID=UPI003F67ECAE
MSSLSFMEAVNVSSSFTLLGFSDLPCNLLGLFAVLLVIYLLTWISNLLLLTNIIFSPELNTPMYFFLGNLSLVDICFSTSTVPQLLSGLYHGRSSISFLGCFLQMYFFVSMAITEDFLLSVMALDRYLAVCNPLRYTSIMNRTVCSILLAACWVTASLHSFLHTFTISKLTYCEDKLIHHFFCDMTSLIKLSCSDTTLPEVLIYSEGTVVIIIPFLLIMVSYLLIAQAIVKLKTSAGRRKAFFSCSSHLTVVCLFYGTIIFIYFRPPSNYSLSYDRLVSLVYTVITPMLNPFIYSLRNQEVKDTLKKFIRRS